MCGWRQAANTDVSIPMLCVFSVADKLRCIPTSARPTNGGRNYHLLQSLGIEANIFNFLEESASDDERTEGLDIADYLLQIEPDQAVLQSMIRRNPYLQTLIDELQLTLVSVERYNPDTDTFPKSSKTEKS